MQKAAVWSPFVLLRAEPSRHTVIDKRSALGQTLPMSRLTRKFVAILMLLWLPLFSGSALAASVSMQMPQGHCQEAAVPQAMDGMDMGAHAQHHDETSAAADQQSPSCSSCGICHLACTAYLAVPGVALAAVQNGAQEIAPYLVSFHSILSAPLVPPPLARA